MRTRLLSLLAVVAAVTAACTVAPSASGATVAVVVDTGATLEVRTVRAGTDLDRLRSRPGVVAVAVDAVATVQGGPDPRQGEQWGLRRLRAPAVWDHATGRGVTVAVLDTGVDAHHPDLTGRVVAGYDALTRTPVPVATDPNGHGTHVAGIVAAAAGNGTGGAGLAPDATILPVRVLDEHGSGMHSDIAAGVIWAVDHGADVVNLSLGGPETTEVLRAAVDYAARRGVVVVAAAGNAAMQGNPTMYPAAYPGVVAVGATTSADTAAMFSSSGPHVLLAGPGMGVLSTVPGGGHEFMSGTSQAAPFVAAAFALARQADRAASAATLTGRLTSTAADLGPAGRDVQFGWGLADPAQLLCPDTCGAGPTLRPQPAPTWPTVPDLPPLPAPTLPDLPPSGTVTHVTVSGPPGPVVAGAPVPFTIRSLTGGSGRQVRLERADGDRWVAVASAPWTTPPVTLTVRLDRPVTVRARIVDVGVSAPVRVEVTAPLTAAAAGIDVTVTAPAGATVTLETMRQARWVPVASRTVPGSGRVVFVRPGPGLYRAALARTDRWSASTSAPVALRR